MSILVFIEGSEGVLKKSSKEAISYAAQAGSILNDQEIVAVVLGSYDESILSNLGSNGATKVINVEGDVFAENQIGVFSDSIQGIMTDNDIKLLVMIKSSFSDNIGGRIAGKTGASVVSSVISLPDVSNGFKVNKSIFTGKAATTVSVNGDIKVLIVNKNTVELQESGDIAPVEKIQVSSDIEVKIKITGKEKAEGDILLEDADIVVSGGRGLKGPENWGIIEDLAKALGAATGCSKPVSDVGWRPHHEHVGQTGVKVSPNLYIAVGISGAIQHLAGVNSSKVLVAINNDPEAPFFKAADYGIVGDAFEVLPKLTEKIKSL